MPSKRHERLVELFHHRPELAAELLQGLLGVRLPRWSEARLAPGDFPQVLSSGHRADVVVRLMKRKGKGKPRPAVAVIVEVQLRKDGDKRKSWLVYLVSAYVQEDCPVVVLVVAPDGAVARWSARPFQSLRNLRYAPDVLGPEQVPVVLGPQEAGEEPELAVLSALAHGKDEEYAPALFDAVVTSVQGLERRRATRYVELALTGFSRRMRRALEEEMRSGASEYLTAIGREFVAQGIEQGRQEGRQEGRLEGTRRALLQVLEARGLKVEGPVRRLLMACTELSRLERWLGLAVRADSMRQIFTPRELRPPQARARSTRPRARGLHAKR